MPSDCRNGIAYGLGSKWYLGGIGCGGNRIFGFKRISDF